MLKRFYSLSQVTVSVTFWKIITRVHIPCKKSTNKLIHKRYSVNVCYSDSLSWFSISQGFWPLITLDRYIPLAYLFVLFFHLHMCCLVFLFFLYGFRFPSQHKNWHFKCKNLVIKSVLLYCWKSCYIFCFNLQFIHSLLYSIIIVTNSLTSLDCRPCLSPALYQALHACYLWGKLQLVSSKWHYSQLTNISFKSNFLRIQVRMLIFNILCKVAWNL